MPFNPYQDMHHQVQSKKAEVFFSDIDGTFECHECDAVVDTARYSPAEKVLTWKCPEGHMSFIEGIHLG